jgi:hypothetical protein
MKVDLKKSREKWVDACKEKAKKGGNQSLLHTPARFLARGFESACRILFGFAKGWFEEGMDIGMVVLQRKQLPRPSFMPKMEVGLHPSSCTQTICVGLRPNLHYRGNGTEGHWYHYLRTSMQGLVGVVAQPAKVVAIEAAEQAAEEALVKDSAAAEAVVAEAEEGGDKKRSKPMMSLSICMSKPAPAPGPAPAEGELAVPDGELAAVSRIWRCRRLGLGLRSCAEHCAWLRCEHIARGVSCVDYETVHMCHRVERAWFLVLQQEDDADAEGAEQEEVDTGGSMWEVY